MHIKDASREYKIPKTRLHSMCHGKYPVDCYASASPIMIKKEENTLVTWIINIAKVEFPVSRDKFLDSVRRIFYRKRDPTLLNLNWFLKCLRIRNRET